MVKMKYQALSKEIKKRPSQDLLGVIFEFASFFF